MSNTLLQPAALLCMLYGGILAGFAYDVCRLPRRLCTSRFVWVLCDCVFVFVSAAIIAGALLQASSGAIRPYLLLGFAAGFLLEQYSISNIFYHVFYVVRARLLRK